MACLELEKIYYKQGNFVLHDINFSVEEGELVALSGRTGSGKSTLIRLIGQAEHPDVGRILYYGKEMYEDERNIRKLMSVMYHEPNFNTEILAGKLPLYLKKIEPDFDLELFHEMMQYLHLREKKKIADYSAGTKKKYMLILALCRNPKLLVLDEPTSGIDDASRREVWKLLLAYRKDHQATILFSTHHEDELEELGARRLILEKGGLR